MPRLFKLTLFALALNLGLMSLMRLAFWWGFRDPADPLSGADLAQSFYLGGKFDLRLVLLLLLPLLLLGASRLGPFAGPRRARLWAGWLTLAVIVPFLVYLLHMGYYAYLHKPLDATVLRFAANPLISAQMVWQSYPVVWGALGVGLLTFAVYRLHARIIARLGATEDTPRSRRYRLVRGVAVAALVVLGLYGQFSWYPLRWSNAFFSPHAFAAAVTVNPSLHVAATLKNRRLNYDTAAARAAYPRMAELLGVDHPDAETLNYLRVVRPEDNLADRRPNVVLVFLESFAAFKTGIGGNPLRPTPHFDALARGGLYFSNYYTPQPGTARSVFTLVTGIPDPEIVRTASRNPLVVDQHSILADFRGYRKHYFLGGSASWGNIRGLLQRNIPGLVIHEEGSYQTPRVDVWGIPDHALFLEAVEALNGLDGGPFLAVIQTSGNHRPYTIPEVNHGFVHDERDTAELRRFGFESGEEYNSFRYMDHSIGVFMEAARKAPWFDNTVFVFFGDHGLPGSGEHMRPADTQLALGTIHVPLVIYAPALLPPRRIDRVASELDVLPTVAGLVLPEYRNTTLGRDLLDPRTAQTPLAFTILNSPNPDIGLIGEGFYFRGKADGSQARLHRLDSATPREDVAAAHPEIFARLARRCHDIYETARYMLYYNGRYRQAPAESDAGEQP